MPLGEKAGDSGRTVQRYIRLASLIDGFLELVDTGRVAMIAGERLSFSETGRTGDGAGSSGEHWRLSISGTGRTAQSYE